MLFQRNSHLLIWQVIFSFLIVALGISGIGYFYFVKAKGSWEKRTEEELVAIVTLKVNQIESRLKMCEENATGLTRLSYTAQVVQQFLEGSPSSEQEQGLRQRLGAYLENPHHYLSLAVIDAEGRVRLSVGEEMEPVVTHARALLTETMQTKQAGCFGPYRSERSGALCIDILSPFLVRKGTGIVSAGVLLIRLNPSEFLYPLVQTWPTPSKSAETFLVRREGDVILFLNEPRHQKNTALISKVPIRKKEPLATVANQANEEVFEGIDYRGKEVLAALKAIRDSNWLLIAKIDREEIETPIRQRVLWMVVLVITFVGLTGGVSLWLWQKQAGAFQRLDEVEHEHQILAQHYDLLSRYSNDIILLVDDRGKIVAANDRAVTSYGYTLEELVHLSAPDLRPLALRDQVKILAKEIKEKGSLVYETIHQRKNGETFPVEISSRLLDVGGKKYFQSIIRDITERKAMGEELKKKMQDLERFNKLMVDRELKMLALKKRIKVLEGKRNREN